MKTQSLLFMTALALLVTPVAFAADDAKPDAKPVSETASKPDLQALAESHAKPDAKAFEAKWKEAKADKKKSGYKDYEAAFMKAIGDELKTVSKDCLKKPARAVLVVGKAGDLSELHSSASAAETKCLSDKTVGFMSAPPPFAPLNIGTNLKK